MRATDLALRVYTGHVSSWWQYVSRIAPGQSTRQIAEKVGGDLAASTVNAWRSNEKRLPRAENVLAFADAYGVPRLEAITAAYLKPGDAKKTVNASMLSDKELIDEVWRRMRRD